KLRAREPLVINDNSLELPAHEAAAFQQMGIRATVCMPLVKDGRLTAVMAVHFAAPHQWSSEEIALIAEVTERSWAHIERAASQSELRDTAEQLRQLNAELEHHVSERSAALAQSLTQFRLLVQGVTDYAIYM